MTGPRPFPWRGNTWGENGGDWGEQEGVQGPVCAGVHTGVRVLGTEGGKGGEQSRRHPQGQLAPCGTPGRQSPKGLSLLCSHRPPISERGTQ